MSEQEILYSAEGVISGGGLQKLLGNYGAEAINVDISLDQSMVRFDGSAEFAGVPLTIDWTTQLAGASRGQSEFELEVPSMTATEFDSFGFQVSEYMKGSLALTTKATLFPGGIFKASVQSDLAKAEINVPEIYWHKFLGDQAHMGFDLFFQKNQLRAEDIQINLGDLRGSGKADLNLENKQLHLEMGQVFLPIGTLSALEVEGTGSTNLRLSVQGGELNLEPLLSGNKHKTATSTVQRAEETTLGQNTLAQAGLVIEIGSSKLDKLHINKDTHLDNILFSATRDSHGWHELSLSGHNPLAQNHVAGHTSRSVETTKLKTGEFSMKYGPFDNGQYPLRIEVENTGALVFALKGNDFMEGGYLVVTGNSSGPLMKEPLQTSFEVDNFKIKEAPAFSEILNMASLSQMISTLKQEGLAFNSFSGDLELDGTRFSSEQMRANGGSLGLLAGGWIDLGEDSMDATGTVVPLHKLNDIVGKIPLLGKVVVGDDGAGIIAIDFTIKGSLDKPEIKVQKNPLNPHLLKNLLNQQEKESATDPP